MFKFGFHISNEEDENNKCVNNLQNNIKWHEAKEVIPLEKYNIKSLENTKTFECNNIILHYVSTENVIETLKNSNTNSSSILKAETNHSDLITGEYEGGLKIWECTSDLINYLETESVTLLNKNVLDLGCGAGLLGIYTRLKGSLVDFQDYNAEVIEHVTVPSVLLNQNEKLTNLENCKFYSGDWESFIKINSSKYDIILTSETIYNPVNYNKLINIFEHMLKPNGIIFLAAKTYYFGVGGGIREFENLLQKNGKFEINVCWKNSTGVQREIIKIKKLDI